MSDKRKLTPFLAHEMLFDFVTKQLDADREAAVEEFIREDKDKIKVSLRSQGTFPANKFAADQFGGGGHLNASGGEYFGSLDEAVKRFEDALPLYKDFL